MPTLKNGKRLDNDGFFLEVEIDGLLWRIVKQGKEAQFFVRMDDQKDEFIELANPPIGVRRLWELVKSDAHGSSEH